MAYLKQNHTVCDDNAGERPSSVVKSRDAFVSVRLPSYRENIWNCPEFDVRAIIIYFSNIFDILAVSFAHLIACSLFTDSGVFELVSVQQKIVTRIV